jgi:ABC-type antimicrobial peptide transport system permease subunit
MAERLADVNTPTFVIIAASLFGLFLICFNTTAHSVAERIGEFALLKAIGLRRFGFYGWSSSGGSEGRLT